MLEKLNKRHHSSNSVNAGMSAAQTVLQLYAQLFSVRRNIKDKLWLLSCNWTITDQSERLSKCLILVIAYSRKPVLY